jgi:hypothetical protein
MRAESSKGLWELLTRHVRALQRQTSLLAQHEGTGTDARGRLDRSVPSAHADGLASQDAGPAWIVVSVVEPPGENGRLAWTSCPDGV